MIELDDDWKETAEMIIRKGRDGEETEETEKVAGAYLLVCWSLREPLVVGDLF